MKRLRVAGKLGHGWEACVLGRCPWLGSLFGWEAFLLGRLLGRQGSLSIWSPEPLTVVELTHFVRFLHWPGKTWIDDIAMIERQKLHIKLQPHFKLKT